MNTSPITLVILHPYPGSVSLHMGLPNNKHCRHSWLYSTWYENSFHTKNNPLSNTKRWGLSLSGGGCLRTLSLESEQYDWIQKRIMQSVLATALWHRSLLLICFSALAPVQSIYGHYWANQHVWCNGIDFAVSYHCILVPYLAETKTIHQRERCL